MRQNKKRHKFLKVFTKSKFVCKFGLHRFQRSERKSKNRPSSDRLHVGIGWRQMPQFLRNTNEMEERGLIEEEEYILENWSQEQENRNQVSSHANSESVWSILSSNKCSESGSMKNLENGKDEVPQIFREPYHTNFVLEKIVDNCYRNAKKFSKWNITVRRRTQPEKYQPNITQCSCHIL